MQHRFSLLSLLIPGVFFVVSCDRPTVPQAKYSHPGWDTLVFAGWTMQAPAGFEVKPAGHIISENDGLDIHFDVWNEAGADYNECNDDLLTENIESSLDWCEEFYAAGSQHDVWLDTINGHYAVLSRPKTTGSGTLSVHFSDCHHSLAMSALNLSKGQEELVLEMFATIKWTYDGNAR